MLPAAKAYLWERQPPLIRSLHIVILLLVLSQIVVSNFMGFTDAGEISRKGADFYATWAHIGTGLLLLPLTLIFIGVEFKSHGLRYFYPYLWGDFAQLKSDITRLMQIKLPEPTAGSIAAIVQGLGLGALCLVLVSGVSWFVSWNYQAPWAGDIKEVHEALTGLVEAYLVGHGGMGLLHMYLNRS